MILPDVNVLLYAMVAQSKDHSRYRDWLEEELNAPSAFGLSDLVLSGFVRVATHPQIFRPPMDLEEALGFVNELRTHPNCVLITPGPRHFQIFTDLAVKTGARGNLIPDAWFAALAIESGCEWITTDRDYSRFPGLRWRHPLQ